MSMIAREQLRLGGRVIMAGVLADRPAACASADGCLYLATDVSGGTLYRCDGYAGPAAWVQAAAAVSGAAVPTFHDAETPTGAVDGVNATFTLAATPSPAASLQLFLNGQLLLAGGADYTLATATITMAIAPASGDILRAWYRS